MRSVIRSFTVSMYLLKSSTRRFGDFKYSFPFSMLYIGNLFHFSNSGHKYQFTFGAIERAFKSYHDFKIFILFFTGWDCSTFTPEEWWQVFDDLTVIFYSILSWCFASTYLVKQHLFKESSVIDMNQCHKRSRKRQPDERETFSRLKDILLGFLPPEACSEISF